MDLLKSVFEEYHLYDLLKNIFYFGICAAIIAILVNPLQFLKILRQQTGERYSKIFHDNYEKGGFKIFYRGLKPWIMLNFLVNAAFGISEFFSVGILSKYGMQLTIPGILIRAVSAAIIEIILTIRSEVKEISKNKGEWMKQDGEVSAILTAVFLRNILNWLGCLISVYFIHIFSLSYFYGFTLSFVIGMIFAIITLPFDVVATHNCGDIERLSILKRLEKITFESGGYHGAYRGSLMRIIMNTCFSVGIVIVERLLLN